MLRQHNDAQATAISTLPGTFRAGQVVQARAPVPAAYSYTHQNHAPRHVPLVTQSFMNQKSGHEPN
jgi:hypothetical protein